MWHDFRARMPEVAGNIRFYIGDVRNHSTLKYAGRRLRVPCRRPQAGALLRVLHDGGLKIKHQAPHCRLDPQSPEIRVIGIRHGEKMYETLLTKEKAAKAIDMGNFYAVPADNCDLNYDKYFKDGDTQRATIEEFNSNNTRRLNLEETKAKIASLEYI